MRPISRHILAGLLVLISMFSLGCAAASEFLAGSSTLSPSESPQQVGLKEPIYIDVSTKDDVLRLAGSPTNHQEFLLQNKQEESWAYVSTQAAINPLQYILLIGAFPTAQHLSRMPPSFAISFSPQGVVSGLTTSTVNAYGDIRSSKISPMPDSSISFYGMRNPDVSHAPANSIRGMP